ncbi:hypothetical protein [Longitalea luteola]|uniref:hypothetical protein n=1 Tax=Longitalea luteola TaxID=2812563 RepID=UPI001A97CB99|nr:hypothetical protein [Longitalea luteola]
MWKTLGSTQKVNQGDKIKIFHPHRQEDTGSLFIVVRTDAHYFEILPIVGELEVLPKDFRKKVVRYFDVNYSLKIEVWREHL